MKNDFFIFRLCSSDSLNQIDTERLVFTNNEIETRPRIEVRGLWIFKFVQCRS